MIAKQVKRAIGQAARRFQAQFRDAQSRLAEKVLERHILKAVQVVQHDWLQMMRATRLKYGLEKTITYY